MANSNLNNIVSTLTDGNLNTQRIVDLGDSILIIGTSERGPVNQPVFARSPKDAEDVFGTKEKGTLLRGFAEVYYGPNGAKDIRLCRISNGTNASLELQESTGDMEEKESYDGLVQITALTVDALEPSDVYNNVTFRQEMVDGQLSVIGYNPISELETVIPYDPTGVVSNAVTDVVGLADAINADPNLGAIVTATANEIDATYELFVDASGVAVFGEVSGGLLTVDLGAALDWADDNDDGFTDNTNIISTSGTPVTAANRIIALSSIYENVGVLEELDSAGRSQVTLDNPIQTTGGVSKDFLRQDLTTDGGSDGEAIHKVVNSYIGTGDSEEKVFSFTAYEAIDPATLIVYRTSAAGTTVTVTAGQYTLSSVGGSGNDYEAQITFGDDYVPSDGSVLTVTYDSEIFGMTKVATLQAVRASNSYKTYFVAGNVVTFGTAQPADLKIAYPAKKEYVIDVDVAIVDAKLGTIQFMNATKQPDYTTGGWVGFTYTYQPEWVNLGTGAQALSGGTNGITMTNAQKYTVLAATYEALADYEVDLVFPMATYLDDTKIVYDAETGLPVEVNAGFAQQLEDYLESLQDGVNETYGMISVKPAASPRLADINTWYDKLAVVSTTDTTRAANVMRVLDAKHLHVVAFEPIVANAYITLPYATTGEAIVAGIICKLPLNQAITSKRLGNQVSTCRFKLSSRQLNTLTGLRYITSTLDSDGTWKITDGVTAAALGSDYARSSTVRIVFGAMDVVRDAGKPFIGNLFNAAKKAALDTAITKGLNNLKEQGALRNYQYTIEQTPQERILGIARVLLILSPEFELRRIEVEIKLSNA